MNLRLPLLSAALLLGYFSYAEGTKQLAPADTDVTVLLVNFPDRGEFGSVGGPATSRLNFRIGDPSAEQVYFGFSPAYDDENNLGQAANEVPYYFRVMSPDGTVLRDWELIDGTTANLTTYAQMQAGPQPAGGSSGYVPFTFLPPAGTTGDYYVEFNDQPDGSGNAELIIPRFDITVATRGGSTPQAIPGRVFSRNWALGAPPTGVAPDAGDPDYRPFDRAFNGKFYVYSPLGFVSEVDFGVDPEGAGFQPYFFNISFNEDGTSSGPDIRQNIRSVEGALATNPVYEVFLNDPDQALYPNGVYGTLLTSSEYPKLVGCDVSEDYFVRVAVTKPGVVEVLFDEDQSSEVGDFNPSTADRLLMYEVEPLPGEKPPYVRDIPWDGLDGNGNDISASANLSIETTYAQVAYHLPIYDAEYMLTGFNVNLLRPTPPDGYKVVTQYDDSDITESPGTGNPKVQLDGFEPPSRHSWNVENFGNNNTINTFWYARRQSATRTLALESDCSAAPSGLEIAGRVFDDADGSFVQDGTEQGIADVTAVLFRDANDNGTPDPGEETGDTDVTDQFGDYSFARSAPTVSATTEQRLSAITADGMDLDNQYYPQFSGVGYYENNGLTGQMTTGVRFDDLNIPAGATITEAELQLTIRGTFPDGGAANDAFSITIAGVDEDAAATFTNGNQPSGAQPTTQTATISVPDNHPGGITLTSADLKDVLNPIVGRTGYQFGNPIALTLSSPGSTTNALFYGGEDATRGPRLVVKYTGPDLPQTYIVVLQASTIPAGFNITSDNVEHATFTKENQRRDNQTFRLAADRDGDGVTDANGDGLVDDTDDADGDGLADDYDNNDTDGPIGNGLDTATPSTSSLVDTDADGTDDGPDADGDGLEDFRDRDADNDGITDLIELGGTDVTGDGSIDDATDTDGDGLADLYDPVHDGPLASSTTAPPAGAPLPSNDLDGDGLANAYDLDSDGDGLTDLIEAAGSDTDGDGRVDATIDADGDGIADRVDPYNDTIEAGSGQTALVRTDAAGDIVDVATGQRADLDGDGVANWLDRDSDNDGLADFREAGGDPTLDADFDGRIDASTLDANGDGLADAYAPGTGTPLATTGADTDNDGSAVGEGLFGASPAANADGDAYVNWRDLDSDGDGITDLVEQAGGATTLDGASTMLDGRQEVPGVDFNINNGIDPRDTDGDGLADYLDLDADNDGIPDDLEAVCTTCPATYPAAGTDANGNGVDDRYEGLTAANATGGNNVGATPNDVLADGQGPDYLDLDTDDDGAFDYTEGFDDDGDGEAANDYLTRGATYETANGNPGSYGTTDTDGDGLPDWLDNLDGPYVTESQRPPFLDPASPFWLDANGNGIADLVDAAITGATATTLPDRDGVNDADWRDAGVQAPLPSTLVSFTATASDDCALAVHWTTESEVDVSHYVVELAPDGDAFAPAGRATAQGAGDYRATVAAEPGTQYLRLRTVDLDGVETLSDAIAVTATCGAAALQLFPNPVASDAQLTVIATRSGVAELTDPRGRAVRSVRLRAGEPVSISVAGLPTGVYTLEGQRIVVR